MSTRLATGAPILPISEPIIVSPPRGYIRAFGINVDGGLWFVVQPLGINEGAAATPKFAGCCRVTMLLWEILCSGWVSKCLWDWDLHTASLAEKASIAVIEVSGRRLCRDRHGSFKLCIFKNVLNDLRFNNRCWSQFIARLYSVYLKCEEGHSKFHYFVLVTAYAMYNRQTLNTIYLSISSGIILLVVQILHSKHIPKSSFPLL